MSKSAIVAGVAPGFGQSLCAALLADDYAVTALARSDKMEGRLGEARLVQCDLTDPVALAETIETTPDVCIFNAHQLLIKPFAETDPETFASVWRNSCLGAMTLAHSVLPKMAKRGSGTMIFTGATAALRGGARFAAFASAKFALRGMAQALAREYHPMGVHVVHTILDGLIWEEQTRERFNPSQDTCLDPDALAQSYMHVIGQDRSAWTHELDLRPFNESF